MVAPPFEVSLICLSRSELPREVMLNGREMVLGRSQECDVHLPNPIVSRFHCKLFLRDDEVCVVDLGSLNGTFLNDQRVDEETKLENGDVLCVGMSLFRVRIRGKVPDQTQRLRFRDLQGRLPLADLWGASDSSFVPLG